MALSKLHQSCIMTGHVNHFCFACERHLKSEDDAYAHMDMGVHQKNLGTIAYLDKFNGENIRKVKCGYFCEFCNIFIKTSTKVGIHVKEVGHINNKGYSVIKRRDIGILIDDKVLIEENSWHSISDDACALCNTDFDDEHIHKNLALHIVNLVGSKLQFGPNGIIYRHIDSNSFQCLTCNVVCALDILDQHSNSDSHKENLEKRTYKIDTTTSNDQTDDVNENNHIINAEKKTAILESVPRYQKDNINIDFLTDTAFCKKCNNTMKLDKSVIEEHIKQHDGQNNGNQYPVDFDNKSHGLYPINNAADKNKDTNNLEKNEPENTNTDNSKVNETETKDLTNFAKENHLTFNVGEFNAYCRVCKVKIPSAMKSLTEHVNGKIHQKNVAYISKSLEVVPKIASETFVRSDIGFSGFFHDDIVVNYKYCINLFSYHVAVTNEDTFIVRCHLCEVGIPLPFLKEHIEEENHKNALSETSVITCLPGEYIREIRTGMYHCGFCNKLFQNWEQVKSHISTSEHKELKVGANTRLRIHMRDLARYRDQKAAEMLFMLMHKRFC